MKFSQSAILVLLLIAHGTPASAAWHYNSDVDEMTSKVTQVASVFSDNEHDLAWPYGPKISATLFVRRHARQGKAIIFMLDKGQINCGSGGCSITVRFDDRPPIRFSANRPADNSSESLFISPYQQFVIELKKSKALRVDVPLYQDGNKIWKFSFDNFDESRIGVPPAQQAKHRSPSDLRLGR